MEKEEAEFCFGGAVTEALILRYPTQCLLGLGFVAVDCDVGAICKVCKVYCLCNAMRLQDGGLLFSDRNPLYTGLYPSAAFTAPLISFDCILYAFRRVFDFLCSEASWANHILKGATLGW